MPWQIPVVVGLTCLLGGCAGVFHLESAIPADAEFDPGIAGRWVAQNDADETVLVVITATQHAAYSIEVAGSDGDTYVFNGQSGRLGDRTVLEAWPVLGPAFEDWPIARLLLVIDVSEDELKASPLSEHALLEVLESERGSFLVEGGPAKEIRLTLPVPTTALAAMLDEYLRRPGILRHDGITLKRVKE